MGLRLGFSLHQRLLPVSSQYAMTLISFEGEHQDSLVSRASVLHQTGPRTKKWGKNWPLWRISSIIPFRNAQTQGGPPMSDLPDRLSLANRPNLSESAPSDSTSLTSVPRALLLWLTFGVAGNESPCFVTSMICSYIGAGSPNGASVVSVFCVIGWSIPWQQCMRRGNYLDHPGP